jgi:hypothetical protein
MCRIIRIRRRYETAKGSENMTVGQAVVYREHTLGVMVSSGVMQVLNSSVLKGAPFFHDDLLYVSDDDVRGATTKDFDTYRVVHHPDYRITREESPNSTTI